MPRMSTPKQPQATIQINTAPPATDLESKPEKEHEEKPPRWFFDRLAEIPTNDWGRVWSVELHRKDPAVPGVPGSKGYLALFIEPITYATIQERYGGGKYRLNLCKNGRWETSHDLDIEGAPKYDLSRENPKAAANGNGNGNSDSKLLDMLQKQFDRMDDRISQMQTQSQTPGQDRTIDMMAEGAKTAMQIVKDQLPQPKAASSEIRELVAALKDMGIIGGASTQQKTIVEQIMELLQTPVIGPALLDLFKPKNPLDDFAKLKGLKDLLDGFGGGGTGGKDDWKTALVDRGIPAVQELVGAMADQRKTAVDLARENARRAEAQARTAQTVADLNARPPVVPAAPQAPAAQPGAVSASQPAPGAPLNAFRVVPMDGTSPAAMPANSAPAAAAPAPANTSIIADSDEYLKGVKLRFVDMLAAGEDMEFIVDFLDAAVPRFVKQIQTYPADQITAFFAGDPILARVVAQPEWPAWLAAAKAYLNEEEPEPALASSFKN